MQCTHVQVLAGRMPLPHSEGLEGWRWKLCGGAGGPGCSGLPRGSVRKAWAELAPAVRL